MGNDGIPMEMGNGLYINENQVLPVPVQVMGFSRSSAARQQAAHSAGAARQQCSTQHISHKIVVNATC
jgi:hypothetical protein